MKSFYRYLLLIVLILFSESIVYAQSINLIPNLSGSDQGMFGSPIVYGSNLYFSYINSSGIYQLAKYDGTTLSLIAIPGADYGFRGSPIVYGSNLYFSYLNSSGIYQLAKYDGTNLSLIANLSVTDQGFTGYPIIYGSNLYFQYQNSAGKNQLAKYDGTNLSLIANPSGTDQGFNGPPIVYGSNLYFQYGNSSGNNQLAKYDGTTLSLIANLSGTDQGFNGNPILYGSNLYFQYGNSSGLQQLGKYDGTSLSTIANISGSDNGFNGMPIVYGSNLYFAYWNSSGKNQLAKFDGTTLSLITNLSGLDEGFGNYPIVYKSNLYIQYKNSSGIQFLAKYDGTAFSLISNVSPSDFGFNGFPIEFGGNLYFMYGSYSGNQLLAKYDGTTISLISGASPSDCYFCGGNIIIYGNNLYIQYFNSTGNAQLGQLIFTTWTGTTNTDWNTSTNWNTGAVPTSTDSATIPATTNKPNISVAGAVAGKVTIQSGAVLTVTSPGTLTASNGITVNPDGALVGSSANITGTLTLQQSIIAQRGWRVFANPFTTTQTLATVASNNAITIGNTVPSSGITDSRTYLNSTGLWSNVTGTTWAAATPYALFIRGLASEVTGSTYSGGPTAFTYSVSGTMNGASKSITPNSTSYFKITPNPFAAPVNSQALTGQVSGTNYYTYQISVTGTPRVKAGSWVASGTSSDATHTIPVLGVLAYTPASLATYNVTLTDINTSGTLQTGLFGVESPAPQIELWVEQDGDYWDKLFVRLDANSTASGKERTDLLKFYNENVNVYTIGNDDTRMAIDARNVLSIIPLGISALAGDYNFKIANNSLPEGTIVYLNDKFLHTKTELKVGTTYNFSITTDTATHGEQRFELSFSSKTTTTANDPAGSLTANVLGNITSGNLIAVQIAGATTPVTIAVKDMNGKALGMINASNGIQYVNVANTAKGMLLLQISDGQRSIIKKVMKL